MAIVVLSDSPMCLGPKGSLVVNPSIAWSPSNINNIHSTRCVHMIVILRVKFHKPEDPRL